MYALNLLGGAAVHGRDGPVTGKAAHKRRVALLAILAAARGRAVGRERLIGLLWPEHGTDAARHLLSESLYVLRKALGEHAFVAAGDEVGLNGEVVASDVEAFGRRIEAGELEAAAALYRGPFLDGFFVADAPEFERWAEGERARLAAAHTRALECLADACEGRGRPEEAAEWWRRLTVLDPYNSRVGMRLMLALDAAGERAAALWYAETHAALLRDELGVETDDDFDEVVLRLKRQPVRVPTPTAAPPFLQPAPAPVAGPAAPGDEGPASSAAVDDVRGDAGAEAEEAGRETDEAGGRRVVPGVLPGAPTPPGASAGAGASSRPRRWWPQVATAVGLMLLVVAAFLPRAEQPALPAPAGYDPQRVAVLYFDDHSRGGELGYLATGLTESLINALAQVPALQVISRNGVKRYREAPARFDSMAADLQAGSLVEGSVQRSGDSVRVTVQLIDANTRAHVESATLVHAVTDVFVLEDALADSVARFLRRRLGQQVALRRTRAETRSAPAWRLVMEGEQARDDAARLVRSGDPLYAASARRQLARADSLYALAEQGDPRWTRPTVQRGWVARARGALTPAPADADDQALAFAERALWREPGSAAAHELRGTVLLAQAVAGGEGAAHDPRLDRAEEDLRAAVAAEPGLASAWNRLSQVLAFRGQFAESQRAARRALAEDAYLDGADMVLKNLYLGALYTRDYAQARALCDRGRERFPGDWRFLECRLTLLRADTSWPPDPALAERVLAQLDTVDPPERARREGRGYSPLFRQAVAAAVLARAGRADAARALLARARAAAGGDPGLRRALAYDEAYVYLALGQADSARALLEFAVARNPGVRAFAARDPLFQGLLAPADAATGRTRAGSR
jgi:DNA-binding SARP family transcriptional activator/TolB-like protein/tetratricopeptide (TPR) repeat protein